MATVGDIESRISLIIQQDKSDFVKDGFNLLRSELNNARITAERQKEWHCQERYLSLSVDPTSGGVLSAVAGMGTGERFKIAKQYYLDVDGVDAPMLHVPKKLIVNATRRRNDSDAWDFDSRFRSDSGSASTFRTPKLYLEQETVFFDPPAAEVKTVNMDAYVFLADYNNDSDTDWFTDNGTDYLTWATVLALNYLTGTYAPRQEGVMPPPQRMRDEAFQSLANFDNNLYEIGRTPFA